MAIHLVSEAYHSLSPEPTENALTFSSVGTIINTLLLLSQLENKAKIFLHNSNEVFFTYCASNKLGIHWPTQKLHLSCKNVSYYSVHNANLNITDKISQVHLQKQIIDILKMNRLI